jgi:ankyrin repeat protein
MMGVPAVAAALGVSAVESWRLAGPRSDLFTAPFAYSLADAIERNDVHQAHAFLQAGQDPNQVIAVRHPVLTAGRPVLVSPILWAVATQNRDAVLMLLGFGARISATDGNAVCLAQVLQNAELVRLLVIHGSQPPDQRCSNLTRGDAPLLAFAVDSESASATRADPAL